MEAALLVLALSPPAHPLQALVDVPALLVGSHLKTILAVAPVTLRCVHTVAVGAEVRPQGALIDPGDADGSFLAKQSVLLGPWRRTSRTVGGLTSGPTLAHSLAATAVHPRQLRIFCETDLPWVN